MNYLTNLYEHVEVEFGTPLLIYPLNYVEGELSKDDCLECYWIVFKETAERGRRISWMIDGHEIVSEGESPIAHNCPLFILDMVPEVKNLEWRNAVKRYWGAMTKSDEGQLEFPRTYRLGERSHVSVANDSTNSEHDTDQGYATVALRFG